jgi:hypothetical protein
VIPIATQNPKPVPSPPALPPHPVTDVALASDRSRDANPAFGPTPLAAAFRFVEPTWRNYISYVDAEARTGNVEAQRYLRIWQSLPPRERNAHVPEQLCELASVTSSDLISWVSKHVWIEGSAKTSMVLSFNRDRVLQRTAEFAMAAPENSRHADLFLRASGAMPQQAGNGRPPINIFNAPVASSGSVALAGSHSESAPVGRSGLATMDEEIVELAKVMQTETTTMTRAEMMPDDDEDEDDDSEGDEDDE